MLPDTTYSGGVTLAGTGLQFSSDAQVVKASIAILKQRNPGVKVLVAVVCFVITSMLYPTSILRLVHIWLYTCSQLLKILENIFSPNLQGGATYNGWANLNPSGIAAFVNEFGLDGVDIDYEPQQANCYVAYDSVSCVSDQEYQKVVTELRAALPNKYLSVAAWYVARKLHMI